MQGHHQSMLCLKEKIANWHSVQMAEWCGSLVGRAKHFWEVLMQKKWFASLTWTKCCKNYLLDNALQWYSVVSSKEQLKKQRTCAKHIVINFFLQFSLSVFFRFLLWLFCRQQCFLGSVWRAGQWGEQMEAKVQLRAGSVSQHQPTHKHTRD